MPKKGYVYLLTNKPHGTLYVGVTSDLVRRIHQHREKMTPGFSSQYDLKLLVWWEEYSNIVSAITREKQIKDFKRAWKIRLIEKQNPKWKDLYSAILGLDCGLRRND